MNQGVQAVADHPPGDFRHAGKIDVGLDLGHLVEDDRLFGDVSGHVADPLQVAVDLDRRRDEAEVARGGLPQRQQADAFLLDLHVDPVDLVVLADDLPRQLGIALQQGPHAPFDGPLRQSAQVNEPVLDFLELPLVFPAGVFLFIHESPPISRTAP